MITGNDLTPNKVYLNTQCGLGIYRKCIEIEGITYYIFEYGKKRNLMLKEEELDTVREYENYDENKPPKLNILGDGKWKKLVKNTKEEINNIANQLIDVAIKRKTLKGYSIEINKVLEQKFIKKYSYELTDGQINALQEIDNDLKSDSPANILLYGSVGSGKSTIMQITAYNAVQNGYQVVIIAPTQMLSRRHVDEFTEIFKSYENINIAFVSSQLSKKKKEELKEQIESGKIDILIGTTSILSQNYNFHKLGLVEIDEEQKYSIKQKELLKTIDFKINQILCTGTAIPRTTYMAQAEILHKVSINSLPRNKKEPVVEVSQNNEEKIIEFISRELNRNGQVFYMVNDIEKLYKTKEYILQLNEKYDIKRNIDIGIVHGKLSKKDSNKIFAEFKNGKYDILISTSIIEVGLTNKNANTMIILGSTGFGLSSLIQCIGRTGRGGIQPYALLLYEGSLNYTARKRLETIEQHTELNNGEAIAQADLIQRGAGQIYGDNKQHGKVSQVGMSYYNELLTKAINKRKEEIL